MEQLDIHMPKTQILDPFAKLNSKWIIDQLYNEKFTISIR